MNKLKIANKAKNLITGILKSTIPHDKQQELKSKAGEKAKEQLEASLSSKVGEKADVASDKLKHVSGQDEALCSELLVSLADSLYRKSADTTYRRDTTLIGKAKDMMHASLQGVLKLDDICLKLEMSKYKFIRLFKAHNGSSPYQYFLNSKLEYAKQIIERNRDIYAAVAACGFVDLAHLNKHFKGVYGITAYEYMMHLR